MSKAAQKCIFEVFTGNPLTQEFLEVILQLHKKIAEKVVQEQPDNWAFCNKT